MYTLSRRCYYEHKYTSNYSSYRTWKFFEISKYHQRVGKAIVIQDDKPIYTINSITVDDTSEYISDEEFYAYADKLLKKDAEVYKQLAK